MMMTTLSYFQLARKLMTNPNDKLIACSVKTLDTFERIKSIEKYTKEYFEKTEVQNQASLYS